MCSFYSLIKQSASILFSIYSRVICIIVPFVFQFKSKISFLLGNVLLRTIGVHTQGVFFCDFGFNLLNGRNLKIGKNVSLGHDNHLWCFSSVSIGDYTQSAKDLLIIAGSHDNGNYQPLDPDSQKVVIGKGCWIGARVTVLGGTSIGYGSIIAAGSVVKGDFEPFSIIGGVPARVIKKRDPAEIVVNPFGEYSISEIKK